MGKIRKNNDSQACPCGGGELTLCCGRFHQLETHATSAEELMRSRYSAYVLGLEDYLLKTWHASTRPSNVDLTEAPGFKWLGLSVLDTGALQDSDAQAFVEFVARFKPASGAAQRMHERSRFCIEDGKWYYLDGVVNR